MQQRWEGTRQASRFVVSISSIVAEGRLEGKKLVQNQGGWVMTRMALRSILACVLAVLAVPAIAATPGPAATFVGYRVMVEPEVVEGGPGRLNVRSLMWRLRAEYIRPDGRRIFSRPWTPPHLVRAIRDTQVIVNRSWRPRDAMRMSPLFRSIERALKRFRTLRLSSDLNRLSAQPAPRVKVVPVKTTKPKLPTCDRILLAKGHHPSHLAKCKGVPRFCAVALLKGGYHPLHLKQCVPGLNPMCIDELLKQGHAPRHVKKCKSVKGLCARALLRKGGFPKQLKQCK
jgi:hypothetical protein